MNVISRAQWGAAPPKGSFTAAKWGNENVVHHTADKFTFKAKGKPGPRWYLARYRTNRRVQAAIKAFWRADATVAEKERASMRAMQSFHQNYRGWTDIGYHYVIYPSGRVYEGRPAHTHGAHCINGNHMPGISFAGNYEVDKPTEEALAAYAELREWLKLTKQIGHYAVRGNSTSCPGKNLKSALGV